MLMLVAQGGDVGGKPPGVGEGVTTKGCLGGSGDDLPVGKVVVDELGSGNAIGHAITLALGSERQQGSSAAAYERSPRSVHSTASFVPPRDAPLP